MKKITTLFLVSTSLVQAQNFDWFRNAILEIKDVVQLTIPVLVALALAVFIWGVVQFIANAGDEKTRGDGKRKIVWGLVGLFVIVSVWGLVALISEITNVGPTNGVRAPQAIFR